MSLEIRDENQEISSWLWQYRKNIYSQSGEDGVIEKVLDILPTNDNWCVEFGAWDGYLLCNSRNLIENKNYSSVLIEGSKHKFSDLQNNYRDNSNIYLVNQFVGFEEDDNLDRILQNIPIPKDFDFLSIDIDGNDYHVWKMVKEYQPKVVCIEFNPTIPTGIDFVQKADPLVSQGSSVSSIVALGKDKGYELVSIVHCNAIFVDAKYFEVFQISDNSIEMLRVDLDAITYLFIGYDGKVFLTGKQRLPWHDVALKASDIQILPRFLQKYPGNYNFFEKVFFTIYLAFKDPVSFLKIFKILLKRLLCKIERY
jgi:hypothetical protein